MPFHSKLSKKRVHDNFDIPKRYKKNTAKYLSHKKQKALDQILKKFYLKFKESIFYFEGGICHGKTTTLKFFIELFNNSKYKNHVCAFYEYIDPVLLADYKKDQTLWDTLQQSVIQTRRNSVTDALECLNNGIIPIIDRGWTGNLVFTCAQSVMMILKEKNTLKITPKLDDENISLSEIVLDIQKKLLRLYIQSHAMGNLNRSCKQIFIFLERDSTKAYNSHIKRDFPVEIVQTTDEQKVPITDLIDSSSSCDSNKEPSVTDIENEQNKKEHIYPWEYFNILEEFHEVARLTLIELSKQAEYKNLIQVITVPLNILQFNKETETISDVSMYEFIDTITKQ